MPFHYEPKRLIPGKELKQAKDTFWVAVPDKYGSKVIYVYHNGQRMKIQNWKKEALAFRRFRDKYWEVNSNRRQFYTLGYFKWKPEE